MQHKFFSQFNSSHFYAMEWFSYNTIIDAFFAVAYGDSKSYDKAVNEGLVFW